MHPASLREVLRVPKECKTTFDEGGAFPQLRVSYADLQTNFQEGGQDVWPCVDSILQRVRTAVKKSNHLYDLAPLSFTGVTPEVFDQLKALDRQITTTTTNNPDEFCKNFK